MFSQGVVRAPATIFHGVAEYARSTESGYTPSLDAAGAPDYASHAIGRQPSTDNPPNTVLIVAQEGYKLHDRVLRPSQVIVSAAPE